MIEQETTHQEEQDGKKPINVFISYKREDNLFNHLIRVVNRTFDLLNSDEKYYPSTDFKAVPFLDCNSIEYGEKWETKVESSIKDSDMLLAFVTSSYITSKACRHEYTYFNTMRDTKKQLCIPVFWSSQKKAEEELKRPDNKAFDEQNTREDAQKVWNQIAEFNGFEGILPKLVDVLAKANDTDYDYVESCIATWLADRIFKVSEPILTGKINKENDEENDADETNVASIDGITLKIQAKNIKATCIYSTKDRGYIVKAGSELVKELTATCPASVPKRREEYKDVIDDSFVLTKDIPFKSPSGASSFVLGRSSNGKDDWKTEDGKKLGELLDEEKKKKEAKTAKQQQ